MTVTMTVSYQKDSVADSSALAFWLENEVESAVARCGALYQTGREGINHYDITAAVSKEYASSGHK